MHDFKTPRLLGSIAAFAVIAVVTLAAGCGGGGGGYSAIGNPYPSQPPGPSPSPTASNGAPVVHINFFGSANGTITTAPFGTVSGYTQQSHAQVLGLAPGTQVVITNNDTVPHTLNVYASAYPAPASVTTTANSNGGVLGPGYQSGPLNPGQSTGVLTVTNAAGNLYIVCGFHYGSGMQDGLVVQVGASPGPQATPSASGTGCHGYGC